MSNLTEPKQTLADAMFSAALAFARFGGSLAKNPAIWMPPADRRLALDTLARLERKAARRTA